MMNPVGKTAEINPIAGPGVTRCLLQNTQGASGPGALLGDPESTCEAEVSSGSWAISNWGPGGLCGGGEE